MTVGEIARMAVNLGWVKPRPRVTIVKMRNWKRTMVWADTKLRWYQTSPNIPYARSTQAYVATGILGSLTGADIGIGTPYPFEVFAIKGGSSSQITRTLSSWNTPGIRFVPYVSKTRDGYAGSRMIISSHTNTDLTALDIRLIELANRLSRPNLFSKTSSSKKNLFYKVYGSTTLESQMKRGVSATSIIRSWDSYNKSFVQKRRPFLLY